MRAEAIAVILAVGVAVSGCANPQARHYLFAGQQPTCVDRMSKDGVVLRICDSPTARTVEEIRPATRAEIIAMYGTAGS